MTRLILIFIIAFTSLMVLGQDIKAVEKKRKVFTKWGYWGYDTTTYEGGIIITQTRQRYLKREHGHGEQQIVIKYDTCNTIIQKTKTYSETKCFSGDTKIKYDKHYKSKCAK